MKKSEIITAILAFYGAALSTVAIVRQWRSDRVKVKLTIYYHSKDDDYQVRITNRGRRPVTIIHFGAHTLYPNLSGFAYETQPQLPCEIAEGQFICSHWNKFDFAEVDYWVATDSHHRQYILRSASRLEHWKSERQFKKNIVKALRGAPKSEA